MNARYNTLGSGSKLFEFGGKRRDDGKRSFAPCIPCSLAKAREGGNGGGGNGSPNILTLQDHGK